MNHKVFAAGLGASVVLVLTSASASAVVIGTASQDSSQAANATQLANGSSATGNTIVLGAGASSGPPPTQNSVNALNSAQAVGGPGGKGAFISPTGSGPTQANRQGANTQQFSANGAIGLQNSVNALGNSQIVGGDQTCAAPGNACAASVIIGSPTQANQQGANLTQSADGGTTTGDVIVTPDLTFNGPAGPISQTSVQPITNSQIILG